MAFSLASIEQGVTHRPPRIVIYGPEGVGKSTFAAGAPSPIFIRGPEKDDTVEQLGAPRTPPVASFADLMAVLGALYTEPHGYQTVVIDSFTTIEPLIFVETAQRYGVGHIEQVMGGFGKGYLAARDVVREILTGLDALRETREMACVVVAHASVVKFKDPTTEDYDRYHLRLNKYTAEVLHEWCGALLFATTDVSIATTSDGTRTRATGGENRILHCEGRPAYVAKNRYGLPAEMPLAWAEFQDAFVAGRNGDSETKTEPATATATDKES